ILDKAKETIDATKDAIGGAIEGIKQMADSVLHPIDSLLGSWGSDLIEGSILIANKTTFEVPNIPVVNTVTNVFIFVTTTFSVCIVMYKVIESQIQASNGSGERLVSNVVEKLIYSSIALAVLPWAMNFFIKSIVSPIGELINKEIIKNMKTDILGANIRKFLISNFFSGGVSSIILF
ncbi:hypothetical protein, partial [Acinetobacter baumannii]|uniref:hypothetical protein n=1 Tax=Acinetobacter baumannii TaxID=470 RepID=UPI001AECBDBF